MQETKLFGVYGTLREGFGNNALMREGTKLGYDVVQIEAIHGSGVPFTRFVEFKISLPYECRDENASKNNMQQGHKEGCGILSGSKEEWDNGILPGTINNKEDVTEGAETTVQGHEIRKSESETVKGVLFQNTEDLRERFKEYSKVLKEDGTKSNWLILEVREMPLSALPRIDRLEGYDPNNDKGSWYKRRLITCEHSGIEVSVYHMASAKEMPSSSNYKTDIEGLYDYAEIKNKYY